jgi:hypothetical protein
MCMKWPHIRLALFIRLSVCLHYSTWELLDGFGWNYVWTLCHWVLLQNRAFLLPRDGINISTTYSRVKQWWIVKDFWIIQNLGTVTVCKLKNSNVAAAWTKINFDLNSIPSQNPTRKLPTRYHRATTYSDVWVLIQKLKQDVKFKWFV